MPPAAPGSNFRFWEVVGDPQLHLALSELAGLGRLRIVSLALEVPLRRDDLAYSRGISTSAVKVTDAPLVISAPTPPLAFTCTTGWIPRRSAAPCGTTIRLSTTRYLKQIGVTQN